MSDAPLVTVIIPARNEAGDLPRCLDAVLAQDHPRDRTEVVVGAGGSTDGTAEVARRRLEGAGLHGWAVLEEGGGATPANLNRCLARATGDVVCRVDARSIVPPTYLRRCATVLVERSEVAVVGGAQRAVARDATPTALGIARALNNRYGMGLARYRRGAASGPTDTVYLGAFRTVELRAEGGWDEALPTNQDYDLNRRMGRRGLVWFDDALSVGYLPRASIGGLWSQYLRFGRWKVRYWRSKGERPAPRQVALLTGPPVLAATAAALVALRPRWRGPVVVAGAAGVAAVELLGSDEPDGGPQAHAVAAVAMAAVGAGWLAGVADEALRGRGG